MSSDSKSGSTGSEKFLLIGLLVVFLVWGLFVVAWLACPGYGGLPYDPISGLIALIRRQANPRLGTWVWFGSFIALLLGAVSGVFWWRGRGGVSRGRKRGDESAKHTGKGKDISSITLAGAMASAKRLGVRNCAGEVVPGLPLGVTVSGRKEVFARWEDVQVDIWGPRTGKTTSRIVPMILAAPGAVVVTSNKSDCLMLPTDQVMVYTDIRNGIAKVRPGSRTIVFDPQGLTSEPQKWWWDPLSVVNDAISAQTYASIFNDATKIEHSGGGDSFWEEKGLQLIACLLLAAACSKKLALSGKLEKAYSLPVLLKWLNNPNDGEPVQLLEQGGHEQMAESLKGFQTTVAQTRSGIYSHATKIANFLLNEKANRWITPSQGVKEFIPAEFVSSIDTLYLFSQEGPGSAAPLMTALMAAVTEAAIARANTYGGRLPVPLTICLDEAANICRWRELPDKYSFFGSKGLCVATILQSYAQGEDAWGEKGMRKLWSAATIKCVGGGVSDSRFLENLSSLIGDHYIDSVSTNHSQGKKSRSVSHASQARRIATVADLESLPARRLWVGSSLNKWVLVEPQPWYETNLAKLINEP